METATPNTTSVIKDPVTGAQFSRDTGNPSSLYAPVGTPPPSSAISSSTLTPQQPVTLTRPQPATQAAALGGTIEANTQSFTDNLASKAEDAKAAKDQSFEALLKGISGTEGQAELTNDAYSKTVDPAQADLADINQQITAEQVSARRAVEALQKNPQGLFGQALQDKVDEINTKSISKQADLSVIQLARQGKYDSAKAIADRAVAATVEKQKNINDALQLSYEDNKDTFTTAEQRQFETAQADRNRKLDEQTYEARAKYDELIKQNDPLYRAQLAKANADAASDTPDFLGQQLAQGLLAPAELSKRATGSGAYNAALKAADDYSMKTTGKHFNIAQADRDYKFANNANTQNTLNYLGSLVGSPDQPGNLDSLKTLSDSVTRTDFPALNDVAAWTRLQAGDPTIVAYNATVTEVADQIAKVLQGGGTGSGTSDAKLAQASALFQKGFTKAQVNATIDAIKPLLQNRGKSIVNNNPYLSDYADQFGIKQKSADAATPTPYTSPAGNHYVLPY